MKWPSIRKWLNPLWNSSCCGILYSNGWKPCQYTHSLSSSWVPGIWPGLPSKCLYPLVCLTGPGPRFTLSYFCILNNYPGRTWGSTLAYPCSDVLIKSSLTLESSLDPALGFLLGKGSQQLYSCYHCLKHSFCRITNDPSFVNPVGPDDVRAVLIH